ncbi:hypothetical protein HDA41_000152 [Streptomyces caelestis]|uniref:Uncharacterized protein n=1 Tax=Streptomyces caelestis TaxID=36816 RepID=A0A7W9GYP1_9ACTN|nr:hypothetical protein [Streptomyces caelestis]
MAHRLTRTGSLLTPQPQGRHGQQGDEDHQEEDRYPHLPASGCVPSRQCSRSTPQDRTPGVKRAHPAQLPQGSYGLSVISLRFHADAGTPKHALHQPQQAQRPKRLCERATEQRLGRASQPPRAPVSVRPVVAGVDAMVAYVHCPLPPELQRVAVDPLRRPGGRLTQPRMPSASAWWVPLDPSTGPHAPRPPFASGRPEVCGAPRPGADAHSRRLSRLPSAAAAVQTRPRLMLCRFPILQPWAAATCLTRRGSCGWWAVLAFEPSCQYLRRRQDALSDIDVRVHSEASGAVVTTGQTAASLLLCAFTASPRTPWAIGVLDIRGAVVTGRPMRCESMRGTTWGWVAEEPAIPDLVPAGPPRSA